MFFQCDARYARERFHIEACFVRVEAPLHRVFKKGGPTSSLLLLQVNKKFCELKGGNIGIVEKAQETRFGMSPKYSR